jgi:hypothetical protein
VSGVTKKCRTKWTLVKEIRKWNILMARNYLQVHFILVKKMADAMIARLNTVVFITQDVMLSDALDVVAS